MKQLYFLFVFALFTAPLMGQVEVTFSVDMSVVGASADGVFVTGSWMDEAGLGGEWQEPGSNMDAALTDDNSDGVYTLTVMLPDGDYQFKYANGTGWPNGEAGGGGDNYQADLSGCGGVDNGFGGYNRTFTVTGTAMTLTTYEFNSCTESAIASTENVSTLGGLMVAPNPATDQVTISFNNDSNTEHTVSLFALTGQLLQQVQLGTDRSVTIDVATLPTGMYLLQFTNELGERGTQKLMVK